MTEAGATTISDITMYQWVTLAMGTLGFLVTWTATVISVTRAVSKIRDDTSEKITEETDKITTRLDGVIQKFEDDQRAQDAKQVTEALEVRKLIASFETRLHQTELFGRDNYVLKQEYLVGLQEMKDMLLRTTSDIKSDLKTTQQMILSLSAGGSKGRATS